jgi:hypothetical protein
MVRVSNADQHTTPSKHNYSIQTILSQGIHTCYQQHIHSLKNKGIYQPDPHQQLLNNPGDLTQKYNHLNDKTIVMIDANEGLFSKNSKLSIFLSQTQLTPLVKYPQHYPLTHIRGSR